MVGLAHTDRRLFLDHRMTDEDRQREQFTVLEMQRVHQRDVFVKQALTERITALLLENLELMAIVTELQDTLAELQKGSTIAPVVEATEG